MFAVQRDREILASHLSALKLITYCVAGSTAERTSPATSPTSKGCNGPPLATLNTNHDSSSLPLNLLRYNCSAAAVAVAAAAAQDLCLSERLAELRQGLVGLSQNSLQVYA